MKNRIILALIVLSYRPLISAQSISAVTNSTGESISAINNNTTAGSGVYGQGFNGISGFTTSGTGNGVYGSTTSTNGTGVLGTGPSLGVVGKSDGSGVYGETSSMNGVGVFGAILGTGTGKAIQGSSFSNQAHAGYFDGGLGVYVSPRLGIDNSNPSYPIEVGSNSTNGNGAHVTPTGIWTNGSSKSFKENFRKLNVQDVLEKVNELDISQWQYIGRPDGDHIGPVAEDFYQTFKLGTNEKYISTLDADGVALAAIQALSQKIEELSATVKELQSMITSKLKRRFLKRKKGSTPSISNPQE